MIASERTSNRDHQAGSSWLRHAVTSTASRASLAVCAISAALALTVAAMSPDGFSYLFHSYLVAVCFVVSIALGSLFFVLLQHLTGAGWSVVLRRAAELLAAAVPYLGLLFLPLLVMLLSGDGRLYEWNDDAVRSTDQLVRNKSGYLNAPFFAIRTVLYFAIWAMTATYFWKKSTGQDENGDPRITLQMQKWSGPAMVAFALTVCFAAFDWLMSLDPHWFSTIFGVYFFSGSVVAALATLTLTAIVLEKIGVLSGKISTEHFHDLGKLLLGFVMFWAYIAFSQYLLIWYANIPEETSWYLVRQENGWQWVSLLLLVGHFVLPFAGLMGRRAKRSRLSLAAWSIWLLLMHWIDLHWLAMPNHSPAAVSFGLIDLLTFGGAVAFYAFAFTRLADNRALVPVSDPRLTESMSFHNA